MNNICTIEEFHVFFVPSNY